MAETDVRVATSSSSQSYLTYGLLTFGGFCRSSYIFIEQVKVSFLRLHYLGAFFISRFHTILAHLYYSPRAYKFFLSTLSMVFVKCDCSKYPRRRSSGWDSKPTQVILITFLYLHYFY